MRKHVLNIILISIIAIFSQFKSIARYPIDESPLVKLDTGLLGIWKAEEDTVKGNFFFVQSTNDVMEAGIEWWNLDSSKKRQRIKEVEARIMQDIRDSNPGNETLIGNMRKRYDEVNERRLHPTREDTMWFLSSNEELRKKPDNYYITYFNHDGTNPCYQQFGMTISQINNYRFLNIDYNHIPEGGTSQESIVGHFFVRIISMNSKNDLLTIAIVKDSTLYYLHNSASVRHRIENNLNKLSFYSDTLHLHKVSRYHLDISEAKRWANP